MSIQSASKKCLTISALALSAVRGLCGTVEIYPHEPVAIPVPHQPAHLEAGYASMVVITRPDTETLTNQVSSAHIIGVTNGCSLFLLSALDAGEFAAQGNYTVVLEDTTNTVSVLAPAAPDNAIVPLLERTTLAKVVINCGRADLDDGLKAVCQQIIALSPNGRYAPYANAYLAIDEFHASLENLAEDGFAPNFNALGANLALMPLPANLTRWAVLYNKGCVYTTRLDQPNTLATFTALTNNIQHSIWTRNATMILNDLP